MRSRRRCSTTGGARAGIRTFLSQPCLALPLTSHRIVPSPVLPSSFGSPVSPYSYSYSPCCPLLPPLLPFFFLLLPPFSPPQLSASGELDAPPGRLNTSPSSSSSFFFSPSGIARQSHARAPVAFPHLLPSFPPPYGPASHAHTETSSFSSFLLFFFLIRMTSLALVANALSLSSFPRYAAREREGEKAKRGAKERKSERICRGEKHWVSQQTEMVSSSLLTPSLSTSLVYPTQPRLSALAFPVRVLTSFLSPSSLTKPLSFSSSTSSSFLNFIGVGSPPSDLEGGEGW